MKVSKANILQEEARNNQFFLKQFQNQNSEQQQQQQFQQFSHKKNISLQEINSDQLQKLQIQKQQNEKNAQQKIKEIYVNSLAYIVKTEADDQQNEDFQSLQQDFEQYKKFFLQKQFNSGEKEVKINQQNQKRIQTPVNSSHVKVQQSSEQQNQSQANSAPRSLHVKSPSVSNLPRQYNNYFLQSPKLNSDQKKKQYSNQKEESKFSVQNQLQKSPIPTLFKQSNEKSQGNLLAGEGIFSVLNTKEKVLQSYKEQSTPLDIFKNLKTKRAQNQEEDHSQKSIENPIGPIKQFFKQNDINKEGNSFYDQEDIKQLIKQNLSQRPQNLLKKGLEKVQISEDLEQLQNNWKPELNEMITISQENLCRKCLHAPSFKLFIVNEFFVKEKETQNKIKCYLDFFQEAQSSLEKSLKLANVCYNQPENHVSLITEYQEGGSLEQILDTCITLPELALKKISIQVLHSLLEFHLKTGKSYNGLQPNQILFDSQGNQKLGLGLRGKLCQESDSWRIQAEKIKQIFTQKQRVKSPVVAKNSFTKNLGQSIIKKEENIVGDDVFEAGLIFLFSAVGKETQILSEEIRNTETRQIPAVIKKNNFANQKKQCCLLHLVLENATQNNCPYLDYQESKFISNLVNRNYSSPFINFLCKCLRFKETERSSIKKLLEDEFLITGKNIPYTVEINELIKISKKHPGNEALSRITEQIPMTLPYLDKYNKNKEGKNFLKKLTTLSNNHPSINKLAQELGISNERVFREIYKSLRAGTKIFQ